MSVHFQQPRCAAVIFLFASAVLVAPANAQTVTWGVGGSGGSGNWDASTANWFNGVWNVGWPEGGNAIFAGPTGGIVHSYVFGPTVSSMTFNTPGYTITDGWIQSGVNGLTITTNADATVGSTLSQGFGSQNLLVKNGPAKLTLTGTQFLEKMQINQGEVQVVGNSSLFFSDVNMANVAGTTITLAQNSNFTYMQSLTGGTNCSIVQPDAQPRTVTLTLFDGANFNGQLQDNGPGVLALELLGNQHVENLTNANNYSGPTSVDFTSIELSGNGSARNSAFSVLGPGSVILDNSQTAVADRLSDTKGISLGSSSIQLIGNSTTPVNEIVGPLTINGACSIDVTQPGSAATQLTFGNLQRNGIATLSIPNSGAATTATTNGNTGIIAPYVTIGNEWAAVIPNGQIVPWSDYASDINAAASADHVKIADAGTTSLAADTTVATLNMQNGSALASQFLDLSGNILTLSTGGLLESGNARSTILDGTISTPTGELIVTANNSLTVGASIVDTGAGTSLTKSGTGTVTLNGVNAYSGITTILQGTLVVSSDLNMGKNPLIALNGGTLKAGADFFSTKGIAAGPIGGTIDTAGHSVTIAGPNNTGFTKAGDGTLTLTNPVIGNVQVASGTLSLPIATSGTVTLQGGTLMAVGNLTTLNSSPLTTPSTLDIGGAARGTLTVGTLTANGAMTLDFDIAAALHDLLNVTGSATFNTTPGDFQFEFHNLGGVTTGFSYELIALPGSSSSPPAANIFKFAPDMAAAGWAGTFQTTYSGVFVTFTAVPSQPGDLNGDNIVNSQDLALVSSNWLESGAGDANGDGIVNSQDIALISSNWLRTHPSGGVAAGQTAAVPEPSTFVLSLLAILGLGAIRHRSR